MCQDVVARGRRGGSVERLGEKSVWHSDLRFILVERAQMEAGEQLRKPAWLPQSQAILRVVGLQSSYQLPLWQPASLSNYERSKGPAAADAPADCTVLLALGLQGS